MNLPGRPRARPSRSRARDVRTSPQPTSKRWGGGCLLESLSLDCRVDGRAPRWSIRYGARVPDSGASRGILVLSGGERGGEKKDARECRRPQAGWILCNAFSTACSTASSGPRWKRRLLLSFRTGFQW